MKTPKQKQIMTYFRLHLKLVAIFVFVVFLVCSMVFTYSHLTNEKSNSIDIPTYTKPVDSNGKIDDTSTTGQNNNKPSDTNANNTSNTSIVFSYASQNSTNGPLLIRTLLNNSSGGTCSYKIIRDSIAKSYNNEASFSGTYYSCNISIPYADMSDGLWNLTVSVNDDGNITSASTNVMIGDK